MTIRKTEGEEELFDKIQKNIAKSQWRQILPQLAANLRYLAELRSAEVSPSLTWYYTSCIYNDLFMLVSDRQAQRWPLQERNTR